MRGKVAGNFGHDRQLLFGRTIHDPRDRLQTQVLQLPYLVRRFCSDGEKDSKGIRENVAINPYHGTGGISYSILIGVKGGKDILHCKLAVS